MTPMKAIRAKCLDCTCGQVTEVKLCPSVECPLYPYRLGKKPNSSHEMTPARKAALERARNARKTLKDSRDTIGADDRQGTDIP